MDVEFKKIKSIKKLKGKRNVFCMATNNGNFVANGIIVKNCDALRYAIASHKPSIYDMVREHKRQEEFLKNKYDPWRKPNG